MRKQGLEGEEEGNVGKTFGATVIDIYHPWYCCITVGSYRLSLPAMSYGYLRGVRRMLFKCYHIKYHITEWSKFLILHSFHQPPFPIVISTTITVTTIKITTIRYFNFRSYIYELDVTHPFQQNPIYRNQLAPNEVTFTPTSEARFIATSMLPAKSLSVLPAKPDPLQKGCFQQNQFHLYNWRLIQCYQRRRFQLYQRRQIHH